MTRIATILIGRNEGNRLKACLASVPKGLGQVVYVDSGSTDGSVDAARAAGAIVVSLPMDAPFTAARARNAGVAGLTEPHDYLQFVDGDCAIDPEWMPTAQAFLEEHPEVAVVCGRRRERFPEASIYNRHCDGEWNTPIGEARACGGDAMIRADAFDAVGGFNANLIAGEEPEMCVRLRAVGWKVWRIDAEMTLHDADITRFSQFWKRAKRAGHAYAEGAALHGATPERHGVAAMRRALAWGAALPLVILLATLLVWPWGAFLALAYLAQVARLALRDGGGRWEWVRAALLTTGKFAEARGVLAYQFNRWRGRSGSLIEYK